jgi:hypothetical protein
MRHLETRSCHQHRHPEFALELGEGVRELDAEWLRATLEGLVAQGRRFHPGETLQLGWSIARIGPLEDGRLTLLEPDFESLPTHFVPGATRSLLHLRLQRSVAESLGLAEPAFPSLRQSAIVCSRLARARPLWLDRASPQGVDSGWFIGCAGESHEHQSARNLERLSLYEVALQQPAVVPYLALPPGVQLLLPVEPHWGRKHRTHEPAPGERPTIWREGQELVPAPGSLLDMGWRPRRG